MLETRVGVDDHLMSGRSLLDQLTHIRACQPTITFPGIVATTRSNNGWCIGIRLNYFTDHRLHSK
jgi:hypothetical protein